MNFFDHKDLGNHLLQLCPKVVKHPVCKFSLSSVECHNHPIYILSYNYYYYYYYYYIGLRFLPLH
jgi:hypothetical protein